MIDVSDVNHLIKCFDGVNYIFNVDHIGFAGKLVLPKNYIFLLKLKTTGLGFDNRLDDIEICNIYVPS